MLYFYFFYFLQLILSTNLFCKIHKTIANCKIVWIKNFIIAYFIKKYKVNLKEAVITNYQDYSNFNDFFTRKLKPNVRNISINKAKIISPVDGILSIYGRIQPKLLIQAKNHEYNLHTLLGDIEIAKKFDRGWFSTLYLSPRDYHRVHMPCSGKLIQQIYIPGKLLSVNPIMLENIPNLFALNERLVTVFETDHGLIAIVMVGATIVGNIATQWHGVINSHHHNKMKLWPNIAAKNIYLQQGNEMGLFKLGSTVILIGTENKNFEWQNNLKFQQQIKLGELIVDLAKK